MFADRIPRNAFDIRLLGKGNFEAYLNIIEGVDWWHMQETSGSVALATNSRTELGRNVATLTYAAYVAGANWANSSGQVARHTAGSTATIRQNGIIAPGKTWQYPVVMSNRTAGSVTITGGDISVSSNGTTIVTITATSADVIVTPSNDFDGDIDLAQGTVKQTDIAASTAFPGTQSLPNNNFLTWAGVFPNEIPTGWAQLGVRDANNYTTEVVAGCRLVSDGTATGIQVAGALIVGIPYRIEIDIETIVAGSISIADSFGSGVADSEGTNIFELVATATGFTVKRTGGATDVTFSEIRLTLANPMDARNTAAAVGQAADGNLGLGYTFDALTSFLNNYSAELNSKFNPAAGTLIAFAKVSGAGVWTDGTARYIVVVGVDSNNIIVLRRSNVNGQLNVIHIEGGTTDVVTITSASTLSTLGYFMIVITWDTLVSNRIEAFYNGSSAGTSIIAGGIEGNLSPTDTVIGSLNTTPNNVWDGDIDHVGLANRVLLAGEILDIWNRSGLS